MSIRSLAVTARRRRTGLPAAGPPVPRAWTAAAEATDAGGAAGGAGPAGSTDALVNAVPTEVIVLYTTVLGVLTGVLKEDTHATYLPLRWILYGGCILATALALGVTYLLTKPPAGEERERRNAAIPTGAQRAPEDLPPGVVPAVPQAAPAPAGTADKPGTPLAETFMACFSFAVWGLVIPGSPLYVIMHPPTLPVVVTVLSAVGAFLATAVFTPWLNRPVSRPAPGRAGR